MEEEFEEQNSEVADDDIEKTDVETNLKVDYYRALEAKNRELYQRAKKAEEEAKKLKAKSSLINNQEQNESVTKNEIQKMLLQEKGFSDVVLEEAEMIAKFKGISIKDALLTPAMSALIEKEATDTKRAKAALGASGGSGAFSEKFTTGMTEDEHKKAWNESRK